MTYCQETAFALREGINILCLRQESDLGQLHVHLTRLLPHPIRLILPHQSDPHPLPPEEGVYHPPDDPSALAACVRMASVCLAPGDAEPDAVLLDLCRDMAVPVLVLGSDPRTADLASRAIILEHPDPETVAALIAALLRTRSLARAAAPVADDGLDYLVDGPHEGSYSLSLLNRELAMALERIRPGRVGLDFLCRPNGQTRAGRGGGLREPGLEALRRKAESAIGVRTVLWNSYPPYVFSRPGTINMTGSYGWEESLVPAPNVERFNRTLDGLTVMSEYVRKVMADNGVRLPVHVVGLGLDHVLRAQREPLDMDLGRMFRFLHVSSCFPRKGVDVLLAAYARAFSDRDDVTLVIKSFPNPHNTVAEQVAALRAAHADCPHIVLVNQDLSEGRLKDLYLRCHALAAPSRGEGFGLPMAEAMLLGLPVITTGYGGQTDFCTPENSWLIDWDFAPAASHLNRFGSVWAEPRVESLAALMREIHQTAPEQLTPRLEVARRTASALTWDNCARKIMHAVAATTQAPVRPQRLSTAMISTWNSHCGIAKYSDYLCAHLDDTLEVHHLAPVWESRLGPDEPSVCRCFGHEDFDRTLPEVIRQQGCAAAVIQFHFSFFGLDRLATLLRELHRGRISVVIIFHSTGGPGNPLRRIVPELALADRLLVHTVADLNRFKDMGLGDNVTYFPQGVLDRPLLHPSIPAFQHPPVHQPSTPNPHPSPRTIAGFGFLLPHKGILELIQAFAALAGQIPNLHLLLLCARYPKPASQGLHAECLEQISALNIMDRVSLITSFLPDDHVLDLLSASELVVFPYQHTQESSSAAVRFGLAARRPVVCTPLPIFKDVAEVVHFLPGTTQDDILNGLRNLLHNPEHAASTLELQNLWLAAHSWQNMGRRLTGLLHALRVQPDTLDVR
ncbi:glycosyltransferase family 4 protein [Desulfonatronum parangueonense]